jgi:hypothetical protein
MPEPTPDPTTHDELTCHCPALGHEVPFGYCRSVEHGLPCRRIVQCWGQRLDIAAFLNQHFTADQVEHLSAPPKDKRVTLYELIQQAKARQTDTAPTMDPDAEADSPASPQDSRE